jgi:hypothetical protein
MRLSLSLVIVIAWMGAPVAHAQTAAPQPATALSPAVQPAVAPLQAASASDSSGRSASRHPPSHRPKRAARRSETASTSAGVALGATDITGNKELPKVMVIVPWKDSLGAGGVVKPTDSLLDQVLQPVDRGVFQRQIHYYGQLNAAQQRPAAAKVAPVGDSH